MKKLSKLFKKTSTGAIQEWQVRVEEIDGIATIINNYGQVDGKIQESQEQVLEGKNTGKTNATTALEQAESQAKSRWEKQLKKGYVQNIEDAQAGFVDAIIEGGIAPMLAHKFSEQGHKIKYPALAQPKLDGCLDYKSKINTDIGYIPIGKIVEEKIQCNVLSYNEITKENEYKPIITWFSNGKSPYTNWMYVKIDSGGQLRNTLNHGIFTNNGWKEAQELNSKIDLIYSTRGSDYLNSLIAGTLLGDTNFSVEKRNTGTSYRLTFQHVNKEYFDFKVNLLNIEGKISEVITGYGSNAWRFVSNALTNTSFPITKFYWTGNDKKNIIDNVLGKRKLLLYGTLRKMLTIESLSLWIADDGSLSFNNDNKTTPLLSLHTQGFSEEQINEFIKYFKNTYDCIPFKYVDKKVINGSGIFLTFSTKDTLFLLNKLRDKQVKGVEYKYYFPTEGYIKPAENKYEFNSFKTHHARNDKPKNKYDLEIQDNHNYYANNILVHNCRATSQNTDDDVTLWSRTRKPINSVPHIVNAINKINSVLVNRLDGELYNHDYHNNFEELVHFIRQEEYLEGSEVIQYHVYDFPHPTWTNGERNKILQSFKKGFEGTPIHIVETLVVNDENELMNAFEHFLALGYEGCMVRNMDGLYVNKRSYDLLKIKEFSDDEFKVVGVKVGTKGSMAGKAVFTFELPNTSETFDAKMKGKLEDLIQYAENPKLIIGKMVTVKYQGYTKYGKPRFPVAIRIKYEE